MSNSLNSSKLINSIKRRAMIPSDQDTFEDEDFLDMLNEEIQYFGVEHLMSTYEEYLVVYEDFDLSTDVFEYEIPERAIGNKLRALYYVDSSNNLYELSRISLEDVPTYTNYNNNFVNGMASTFYIQGNKIVLADEVPFTEGSLRMFFYLKPNKLVDESRAGKITSIDRNTGIVTVSNFPEDFSNLPVMDFVQTSSPNKILSYNITPTSVNVNTKSITFSTSDIPSLLKVGDYINFAGETIYPQMPTELHAVLTQRVAVACLEALGDDQGLQRAQQRLEMMEKSTLSIIDNRVESANQKLRNKNSPLQETTIGNFGYGRRGKF